MTEYPIWIGYLKHHHACPVSPWQQSGAQERECLCREICHAEAEVEAEHRLKSESEKK